MEQICVLNGAEYHVRVCGSGRPLLLLHGFTGSGSSWDHITETLASRYRCICPDLLGHGRSACPPNWERYSMLHATADMVALLDILEIENTAVVGYSLGGRLALSIATTAPTRVSALVLESASPGLATSEDQVARTESDDTLARRIEQEGLTTFVDYWEGLPLFASQQRLSDPQRNWLRTQRMQHTTTGLAGSLRGMSTGRQKSFWAELPLLPMPVLLIVGDEDRKFRTIAAEMHHRLRRGVLATIPESGHNVHLEQPTLYLETMLGFLNSLGNHP